MINNKIEEAKDHADDIGYLLEEYGALIHDLQNKISDLDNLGAELQNKTGWIISKLEEIKDDS